MTMDREVSGAKPGGIEVFCTYKEKLIYTKYHELNCLACRSRAILPTFVGLCLGTVVLVWYRLLMADFNSTQPDINHKHLHILVDFCYLKSEKS